MAPGRVPATTNTSGNSDTKGANGTDTSGNTYMCVRHSDEGRAPQSKGNMDHTETSTDETDRSVSAILP